MQDICKVCMDSLHGIKCSCFTNTWIVFKILLLEVGLTQNWETMAPWNLTTNDLLYFYHVIHWISIWLRAQSHMTSHYTWGHVTTLYDFGGVLGWPLDISFGLSWLHGNDSWLMCEVTLRAGLHHGPWKMAFSHGLTSWSSFHSPIFF
jgi:hypothetical protein